MWTERRGRREFQKERRLRYSVPLPDSSMAPEMKDAVGDAVAEDGGNTIKGGSKGGANSLSKPSSKVLRQDLIEAGVGVPDYPNAAHHTVAGSLPKAADARAILQKYGVDINDLANVFYQQ